MKRLLAIAVLAINFQIASAQFREGSIIHFRLSDNSPFRIYFDGQPLGKASAQRTLSDVAPGRHYIQVYRVVNTRGYQSLDNAYRGFIYVDRNTESFITVLPDRLSYDRIVALNRCGNEQQIFDASGRPAGYNNAPNPNSNYHWQHEHYGEHNSCKDHPLPYINTPQPMDANSFSQLKCAIENGSFESTRLSIFKQALPCNYFTSSQIAELMDLFWFESTKLEVAKLAYDKTLDKQNFYIVNNQFSFSSSVNDLGNYIAMR